MTPLERKVAARALPRILPLAFTAFMLILSCATGYLMIPGRNHLLATSGTPSLPFPAADFVLLFACQWVLSLLMLLLFPRSLSSKKTLYFIFAVAAMCRLLLFAGEPSDDMNRYLWEGRVLLEGISPYHHGPDDPLLSGAAKDDLYHGHINHPGMTAAYPPLVIALFSLAGSVWYHPLAVKGMMILMDLGTMVFLTFLLSYRHLDYRWLVLYALNPVILWSFSAEGHFDVMQCLLLSGALHFYNKEKWGWMFLLAGLSVQVKYVSFPALLFFVNRRNIRYAGIALAAAILPYIAFFWVFPHENFYGLFSSLFTFGQKFAFNGSVHALLRALFEKIEPAAALSQLMLAGLLIWGLFYFHPARNSRYRNDPVPGCFFVFGCVLLLAPTVHVWYLTWIIPFLVLQPSKPWILLCLTIGFYFVTYGVYEHTGHWRLPLWAHLCEWLPFYVLLTIQGAFFLKQMRAKPETDAPETVSVVIPALNEETHIIQSVSEALKDPAVTEVIVVDGGSSDRTSKKAVLAGARVVQNGGSPKEGSGRGGQIVKGIAAARGDLVAVVHADTLVSAPDFTRMCRVLEKQPRLCGGALGSVFESRDLRLGLINFLNDFRAAFMGISFGDQVQFFRRKPVLSRRLFPNIPLMEDVEFSIRLSTLGPQAYLFGNAPVSPRRWETQGFLNAFGVIKRVTGYLLRRTRGIPDTSGMYRSYYGKNKPFYEE